MLNKVPVEMIDYDFGKLPNLDNVYTKDETYSKAEVYSKDEAYSKEEVYNKTEIDEKLADAGGLDYINKGWKSYAAATGWLIFTFEQDTANSNAMTRMQAIIEGSGWGGNTGGGPFKLSIVGLIKGDGSQFTPACTLLTNGTTSEDHPVCYQKDGTLAKIGIYLGTGSAGFVRVNTNKTPDGNYVSIKDVSVAGDLSSTPPLKYTIPVAELGGGSGGGDVMSSVGAVTIASGSAKTLVHVRLELTDTTSNYQLEGSIQGLGLGDIDYSPFRLDVAGYNYSRNFNGVLTTATPSQQGAFKWGERTIEGKRYFLISFYTRGNVTVKAEFRALDLAALAKVNKIDIYQSSGVVMENTLTVKQVALL